MPFLLLVTPPSLPVNQNHKVPHGRNDFHNQWNDQPGHPKGNATSHQGIEPGKGKQNDDGVSY